MKRLPHSPAVALLGPRQASKTTLAFEVGRFGIYLDFKSEQGLAKFIQPELYLADHQERLVTYAGRRCQYGVKAEEMS